MSKQYDAVAKDLLALDPGAWAGLLGVSRPAGAVQLIDSDLSTVTAAADQVLAIGDNPPWIIDIEFQSWCDPKLPRQLLKYNALLQDRHKQAVASVLVVMRPSADSPAYTGRFLVAPPFGPAWEFGYTVVKVWETPADQLLRGPLALTPFAPVANLGSAELGDVLHAAVSRTQREADPGTASRMFTAVGILLQLRYGEDMANDLIGQFPEIRDMAPFKKFLDEGRVEGRAEGRAEEARAVLLRQGQKKFGPASTEQAAAITATTDLTRLDALIDRVLDVATWDELLKPQ